MLIAVYSIIAIITLIALIGCFWILGEGAWWVIATVVITIMISAIVMRSMIQKTDLELWMPLGLVMVFAACFFLTTLGYKPGEITAGMVAASAMAYSVFSALILAIFILPKYLGRGPLWLGLVLVGFCALTAVIGCVMWLTELVKERTKKPVVESHPQINPIVTAAPKRSTFQSWRDENREAKSKRYNEIVAENNLLIRKAKSSPIPVKQPEKRLELSCEDCIYAAWDMNNQYRGGCSTCQDDCIRYIDNPLYTRWVGTQK